MYSGRRVTTVWLRGSHEVKQNGPVPSMPLTPKSRPSALTLSSLRMVAWNIVRFGSSSLNGSSSSYSTVKSPLARTSFTLPMRQ